MDINNFLNSQTKPLMNNSQISEYTPKINTKIESDSFKSNNNQEEKQKSWFKRHPIVTIGSLLVLAGAAVLVIKKKGKVPTEELKNKPADVSVHQTPEPQPQTHVDTSVKNIPEPKTPAEPPINNNPTPEPQTPAEPPINNNSTPEPQSQAEIPINNNSTPEPKTPAEPPINNNPKSEPKTPAETPINNNPKSEPKTPAEPPINNNSKSEPKTPAEPPINNNSIPEPKTPAEIPIVKTNEPQPKTSIKNVDLAKINKAKIDSLENDINKLEIEIKSLNKSKEKINLFINNRIFDPNLKYNWKLLEQIDNIKTTESIFGSKRTLKEPEKDMLRLRNVVGDLILASTNSSKISEINGNFSKQFNISLVDIENMFDKAKNKKKIKDITKEFEPLLAKIKEKEASGTKIEFLTNLPEGVGNLKTRKEVADSFVKYYGDADNYAFASFMQDNFKKELSNPALSAKSNNKNITEVYNDKLNALKKELFELKNNQIPH